MNDVKGPEFVMLTDIHFRALLDLFMCSDPYPCNGRDEVKELLDEESLRRGYSNWIDAYHECPRKQP